ncbi:MAG: hypothetical protein U1F57_08240 [bacterium]
MSFSRAGWAVLFFFSFLSNLYAEPINLNTFPESKKIGEVNHEWVKEIHLHSSSRGDDYYFFGPKESDLGKPVFIYYSGSGLFLKDLAPLSFDRFDTFSHLLFDEKTETLFYIGQKGKRYSLVINGREGPFFDYWELEKLDPSRMREAMSPDGRRILYEPCYFKPGTSYPLPSFTKCEIVLGDAQKDEVISLASLAKIKSPRLHESGFGADNKGYYFILEERDWNEHGGIGPYVLVVDGKAVGKPFSNVSCDALKFRMTNILRCAGTREGKPWVYENGAEREVTPQVSSPSASSWKVDQDFSEDLSVEKTGSIRELRSKKVDGKYYYRVNGKEYGPYFFVGEMILSPDGNRFAFKASRKLNDKHFYVVDGKEEKAHEYVSDRFSFSPDSRRYVYMARDEKPKGHELKPILVVEDGKENPTPPFDNSTLIVPFFTPDSKNIVYWTRSDRDFACPEPYKGMTCSDPASYLAVKGKLLSDEKDWIMPQTLPQFSPDGKKVGYLAIRGDELWWMVKEIQ